MRITVNACDHTILSVEEKDGGENGMTDNDVEELHQVLKTVSEMVPNLIKGIMNSIFSAEAGKNMGAAAANFYKELKAAGIPEDVAVKMTQDYVKTFTDIGGIIKEAVSKKGKIEINKEMRHGKELGKAIKEEVEKKIPEEPEEE
ncbi:hypothetical protein B6U79_01420 [Candidatus Bathyarchaeota archaeon ex4484_231]|nr:MAG: hypothetical protein B6U79_01420 [Candidatus Bathyarchaeota archaeon ex4484_231]